MTQNERQNDVNKFSFPVIKVLTKHAYFLEKKHNYF